MLRKTIVRGPTDCHTIVVYYYYFFFQITGAIDTNIRYMCDRGNILAVTTIVENQGHDRHMTPLLKHMSKAKRDKSFTGKCTVQITKLIVSF